ncbi:hypothetical protein BDA96_05G143200 [Sorghum bicolor]|uniref:Uncharacterized protein n=1 Tax=Sorghum bicolor TaxID=4558 RepID=A0A921R0E2_SORBI|nr:hypothetical protein BDA96_05G143200 [Sorghum bicolor]
MQLQPCLGCKLCYCGAQVRPAHHRRGWFHASLTTPLASSVPLCRCCSREKKMKLES